MGSVEVCAELCASRRTERGGAGREGRDREGRPGGRGETDSHVRRAGASGCWGKGVARPRGKGTMLTDNASTRNESKGEETRYRTLWR